MINKQKYKKVTLDIKNAIVVLFLIIYLIFNWNPKKVKGA